MKDNDSELIGEAYDQVQEGVMGAVGGAADTALRKTGQIAGAGVKMAGKAAAKGGLNVGGALAKGTGIGLDGILNALNFLTSDQLKKVGDACMRKASEIKVSNEEDFPEDGENC
jgi:hypothetical protein